MCIGECEVCFKTTFLGISFHQDKMAYIVKTKAGSFEMPYKSIEIKGNEIIYISK